MDINRSSAVASSAANYAGGLRTQRLRDSYQFNQNQLDAVSSLSAVNTVRSPLLASPPEMINTVSFNSKFSSSADVRLSTTGKIQSALSSLKTGLDAQAKPELRAPVKAVSGDDKVVTATANDSVQLPASQAIVVSQLAQTQKLESTGFASADASVGSGTLTIKFGSFSSGTGEFTANGRSASVEIESADASLGDIANAVNRANVGLKAEVVTESGSSRLRVSSAQTGADQAFTVSVRDDDAGNTDNTGLSRIAFDPAAGAAVGQNLIRTQVSQDASLTVNGRAVLSASNTVRDDATRTTLALQAAGTAEITYSRDKEALSSSVKKLAEDLNKARSQLAALNEGPARREMQRLQGSINAVESGSGLMRLTLVDLGVETGADGKIRVNETKLAAVLDKNPEGVNSVLGDAAGRLGRTVQTALSETNGLGASLRAMRDQFSGNMTYSQQNSSFSLLQSVAGYSIPSRVLEGLRRYVSISRL